MNYIATAETKSRLFTQLKITIQHKLMQAAVQVVKSIAELLLTRSPYTCNAAKTDILYNTTATTVAIARAT